MIRGPDAINHWNEHGALLEFASGEVRVILTAYACNRFAQLIDCFDLEVTIRLNRQK